MCLFGESCFPQGTSLGSGGILETLSPRSGNMERSQGHGPAVPADSCPWPRLQAVAPFSSHAEVEGNTAASWQLTPIYCPLVSASGKRGLCSSQSLEGEPRAQASPQKAGAAPASTDHAPQAADLESRLYFLLFLVCVWGGGLAALLPALSLLPRDQVVPLCPPRF